MDLRQNTAKTIRVGPFLDEDDGKTQETTLTINQADIRLSKDGGAYAQSNDSGGATHDEKAYYSLQLDATDSNTAASLRLGIHVAGALPVFETYNVLPANVYDAKYSTDKLEVDVVQIGGTTQSATDLKDFADAGYDPATNKVEGVKTVDTLTGHTPQTGDSYARLGAPAGASVSADVAAVKVDTAATLVDTNETQTKLPTNEIMGSSVKTDKDDEIDAIKAKTDNLPADPTSLADMKDSMFNRDVVSRHANQKPSQYTAGTGGNQETINTTQDGSGNTETETKA